MKKKLIRKVYKLREEWKSEFYECVKDIIEDPVVLRMKLYPHHGNSSCYKHCINVGYYNYRICKILHLDARSAARAGMLHDMFLYDWHEHKKETGDHFHGMTHPKEALRNASKFFELNKIERDIILTHMWPVTFLTFPRTKEGWITTITDKYCGSCETSQRR